MWKSAFLAVTRRRIWCPYYHSEMEVELEEVGLPGVRDTVALRSCSAFENSRQPTCARQCLDPRHRGRPRLLPI